MGPFTMGDSLFRSGLGPRLAVAALYAAAALGAVALFEPSAADHPASSTAPARTSPAPARATLCIESLQPVAGWEVHADGLRLQARRSDATVWLGPLPLAPDTTIVVDAIQPDGLPPRRNALRIRIAGTAVPRDQTFWCEGTWSVATQAGRLSPAPATIDPEDLP